jgi:signal transduction histidine kinase
VLKEEVKNSNGTISKATKTKDRYYFRNRSSASIILIYNLITVILIAAFYPIIPILLNYPPNNEEVSRALGTSNYLQYILGTIYSCTVGTIFLVRSLKVFKNWESVDRNSDEGLKRIREIRKKSMDLPVVIFILQIAALNLPLIFAGLLVTALNNSPRMVVAKVILMTISLFSLAAVSAYIFSKRIFKSVLLKTYIKEKSEGRRINLQKNIFIQITPMLIVAILFTIMIGYSRVVSEKGDLMYGIYNNMLTERLHTVDHVKSVDDALNLLEEIKFTDSNPIYFVKSPNGKITTSNQTKLGGYFLYYISNPYNGNRMFDLNAETQGIVMKVNGSGGEWRIGLIFQVTSYKTIVFFIVSFIALLLLNAIVLYYFAKSLSDDISLVAESLTDIANGENVDLDKNLPVTSNDEIGDLVIAFNKIQEREKEHVKEVEDQQAIIVERERLASLGQLIGGIAHNMRTPIMSISGAIEGLKDLVREYEHSIGDQSVSDVDHHEIVRDMEDWLSKMGPYCSYMSDIITAVKEQTVQHSDIEELDFTIGELTDRVELLMNNELKRSCCFLKTDYKVDRDTRISGDMSILVQVLNNLITNAIQSYEGTGHDVEFIIQRNNSKIEFIVKDYGPGIQDEVKDKIFKEMVTTKGKQGTGLGLFISYSNIKARFKGNMWLESEEGKGTTFYVSIPC